MQGVTKKQLQELQETEGNEWIARYSDTHHHDAKKGSEEEWRRERGILIQSAGQRGFFAGKARLHC